MSTVTTTIGLLQDSVEALQYWFWIWNNGLLLNQSKSAIVYFGTHGRLRQSILPSQSQIIAVGCRPTVNVSDRLFLVRRLTGCQGLHADDVSALACRKNPQTKKPSK